MNYFSQIINEYITLKTDFIGVRFDLSGFISFVLLILFSLLLFIYMYLVGEKIRNFFFKETSDWSEKYFINFALGYIVFCSGIALLGIFSLLTLFFISVYLLVATFFILFPFKSLRNNVTEIIQLLKNREKFWKSNTLLKVGILLFVSITFLRLIPPEIDADAMYYHTSSPKLYLFYHTTMLSPSGVDSFITAPQLSEIPYVIAEYFQLIDATRIIHFLFYVLCVLLLLSPASQRIIGKQNLYVVLLLVTSPLILHIAASSYSDFQVLYCFLLSIFLLTKKHLSSRKIICLSGIFFGGALASKIWALAFIPAFLLYIIIKNLLSKKTRSSFSQIFVFLFSAFGVALLWYIRSYLLSGNPFYYHDIVNYSTIQRNQTTDLLKHVLNWSGKLNPYLLTDYSPLIIFGIIGILFSPIRAIKINKNLPISLFVLIFSLVYLFLPAELYASRYILLLYILLAGIVSAGFLYYLINTVAILPYGIGWANKETYLSRSIAQHNGGYYDFDHIFSKHLHKDEVVATYGLTAFYYASFIPKDIYHIFEEKNNSLTVLKKQEITKLLIRGGDVYWFCRFFSVSDCGNNSVILLASYPQAKQYLYQIK